MVWLDTEYLGMADETIQTVIVGGNRVIYVHYYNGYYSLIEGVNCLDGFLRGDVSERFACAGSEDGMINILKNLEK